MDTFLGIIWQFNINVRQDEINIITSFAEIAKTGKSGK